MSLWAIVPVAATLILFFVIAIPSALRARRLPVVSGPEQLVGTTGEATTDLTPEGTAQIGSELWSVESVEGEIQRGEPVRVVQAEGIRLKVAPLAPRTASSAEADERRGA